MKNNIEKTMQILNIFSALKKTGKLNPLTAKMLMSAKVQGVESKGFARLLNFALVAEQLKTAFDEPDENVTAPIKFAYTGNNVPVGLFPEECHFLICGQTGSGKTILLLILLIGAFLYSTYNYIEKLRSWIFSKAPDLRALASVRADLLLINFETAYRDGVNLNPFEPPPLLKPLAWIPIISDIFIQGVRLYDGTRAMFIEKLSELYEKYQRVGHYPCLHDFYEYVKSTKYPGYSRDARYRESILNRVSGYLKGPLGDVFRCSRGHTSNLINKNVIFEIFHLPLDQQVFIVNYLISYLFIYKMANETNIRNWIAIDDANAIFDASFEKRPDLGLPIIHHLTTTVRKNKINLFACTQTPHQIGSSIHANTFAKIMLRLSDGKDIKFMAESMGLTPEQKEYAHTLEPREAIVKFSSRYVKPFIARIPEVNI